MSNPPPSRPGGLRWIAASSRRALLAVAALLLVFVLTGCEQAPVAVVDTADSHEVTVPLLVAEGPEGSVLALVPIFIEDQGPFAFALDTGASRSLVDQRLVEQLGLPVTGRAQNVVGVTGVTEATTVGVEQWRAGEVPLPAAEAITLELPGTDDERGIRGLLGSDILSHYGAITVDYDEELLILRARR